MFLRFEPEVALTSALTMLYNCLRTSFLEFLMLLINFKRFLTRIMLQHFYLIRDIDFSVTKTYFTKIAKVSIALSLKTETKFETEI